MLQGCKNQANLMKNRKATSRTGRTRSRKKLQARGRGYKARRSAAIREVGRFEPSPADLFAPAGNLAAGPTCVHREDVIDIFALTVRHRDNLRDRV